MAHGDRELLLHFYEDMLTIRFFEVTPSSTLMDRSLPKTTSGAGFR